MNDDEFPGIILLRVRDVRNAQQVLVVNKHRIDHSSTIILCSSSVVEPRY